MTATTPPPGFAEDWSSRTLGEIANHHRDTVDPRRYPSRLFEHYSLPAFDSGQGPIKEQGSAIESIKFVLPPDAVMVSKLNPRIPRVWAPEKIGKNAISSTEFLVLTARAGVKRSFLHWLLKSDAVGDRMKRLAVGTTGSHARIHPTQVRAIEVQVPGDREQYAIANALDDIDELISALTAFIAKKQAIKQGMMQELLTGQARLPGFSMPWRTKTLDAVSDIDPETIPAETGPSQMIDYVSLEDVSRGRILGSSRVEFGNAPSRARRAVRPLDVLFGTVRPNLQSHAL